MHHFATPLNVLNFTHLVFEELGAIVHRRGLAIAVADAATHGLFVQTAQQHPLLRESIATSLVVASAQSLKNLLHVDIADHALDALPCAAGVGMARNALAFTNAQLGIALTLGVPAHPGHDGVLGLHWWYRDALDEQNSWMLSQQLGYSAQRSERDGVLIDLAACETLNILRLQDDPEMPRPKASC